MCSSEFCRNNCQDCISIINYSIISTDIIEDCEIIQFLNADSLPTGNEEEGGSNA